MRELFGSRVEFDPYLPTHCNDLVHQIDDQFAGGGMSAHILARAVASRGDWGDRHVCEKLVPDRRSDIAGGRDLIATKRRVADECINNVVSLPPILEAEDQ